MRGLYILIVPGLESLAAEFGRGQLTDATPMPGHPQVVAITTERGAFLVRPAGPDPALYDQVAHTLVRAGIRQAMPLRTAAGSLVSESGLVVQEFLPSARRASLPAARRGSPVRP